MTPLQKGMAKEYLRDLLNFSLLAAVHIYSHRSNVKEIIFYFMMWICMPIISSYDYYLSNRKKEENKPATYWIDALKLFMVWFLFFSLFLIYGAYLDDSDWSVLYYGIPFCAIFCAILAFIYWWNMRKNKK